ncbi:MAG TPA: Hsp20/alpha crystallin family protein [Acidobacteriota bacterium]|jgi:HSP20 family protein|nr:Hsp20/alpha crystallin family protein [Acidobacteriota bacterium]
MTTTITAPEKAREQVHRFDPYESLDELQEEFFRFFGSGFPLFRKYPHHPFKTSTAWYPRVDIYEKSNSLIIKADLPGIKKEDVHVSFEDGDLILKGEAKTQNEAKEDDFYRLERAFGKFYRRIPVPFEVEIGKVVAKFEDGVLEIRIPRPAGTKPQPREIPVH